MNIVSLKQRLISAVVGIGLLAGVLILYNTYVLIAALAILSAIAVYELLVNTKFLTSRADGIICSLYAGCCIFLIKQGVKFYVLALIAFWVILILCKLAFHKQFTFLQLTVCVFAATAIPLSFATVMMMIHSKQEGPIYFILACIAAWVTDSAAFIVGNLCGKRKIAPEISPNKTLEGVIGGLVATGILFPLACYGYWRFALPHIKFSFSNALIVGLVCAFSGMLGDLFASTIKRETGIKDFGNIMPGHGGVMDRFDSFLFVAPTLYFLIQLIPIFL